MKGYSFLSLSYVSRSLLWIHSNWYQKHNSRISPLWINIYQSIGGYQSLLTWGYHITSDLFLPADKSVSDLITVKCSIKKNNVDYFNFSDCLKSTSHSLLSQSERNHLFIFEHEGDGNLQRPVGWAVRHFIMTLCPALYIYNSLETLKWKSFNTKPERFFGLFITFYLLESLGKGSK